jgi:hypothetical protein
VGGRLTVVLGGEKESMIAFFFFSESESAFWAVSGWVRRSGPSAREDGTQVCLCIEGPDVRAPRRIRRGRGSCPTGSGLGSVWRRNR